jgi:hypothetical protein
MTMSKNIRIKRTVYPPQRPPYYSHAAFRRWEKVMRIGLLSSREKDYGYLLDRDALRA